MVHYEAREDLPTDQYRHVTHRGLDAKGSHHQSLLLWGWVLGGRYEGRHHLKRTQSWVGP